MIAIALLILYLCDHFVYGFDVAIWVYVIGGIIAIIELYIYFGDDVLDALSDL